MTEAPAQTFAPGDVIADCTIERCLGCGGMGEVYLARKGGAVTREVAVKILKQGVSSREARIRFEAERRALSLMNHRHVAKVLDAGETDEGLPYFVMEYVPGETINEYCDRRRLDIDARVKLLIQICEGLAHAHQRGIIHRDLKPGNVLVTEATGVSEVKIIDFGVAKSTRERLTADSFQTKMGVFVGTPHYASPEQISADVVDLDTRADVYALGVIMYELLVGVEPLEAAQFSGKSLLEIQRLILKSERTAPAVRYQKLAAGKESIAAARRTDPKRLRKILEGDLGFIAIKALRRRRERRYASVFAMQADLARYLAKEAVTARPPAHIYLLGRFLARHPVLVTLTMTVIAALIGAAMFLTFRLQQLESEYQLAVDDNQSNLARADLLFDGLAAVDPRNLSGDSDISLFVKAAAERYQGSGVPPRTAAAALFDLAESWRHVDPELAASFFNAASSRVDLVRDNEIRLELEARRELTKARMAVSSVDQMSDALDYANLSAELYLALDAYDGYAEARSFVADTLNLSGHLEQALQVYDELSGMPESALARGNGLLGVAEIRRVRQQHAGALEALEEAARIGPQESWFELEVERMRAAILLDMGHYQRAIDWYRNEVERVEEYGTTEELAEARTALAYALIDYGDIPSALEQGQLAMAADALCGECASAAGIAHALLGRRQDARAAFERAEQNYVRALGEHSDFVADVRMAFAHQQIEVGNLERADRLLAQARPVLAATFGKRSWQVAVSNALAAILELERGSDRPTDALGRLKLSIDHLDALQFKRHWMRVLAAAYLKHGQDQADVARMQELARPAAAGDD